MTFKSLPLFILISSGLLNAAVVPGRWEKVDSLPFGRPMVVTLKGGDSMRCTFNGSDLTTLTVTTGGSGLAIPKADVGTIVQQKPPNILKAALIGTGVGAAAGVAIVAAVRPCTDCEWNKNDTGGAITLGLIGAGIGYWIGKTVADDFPSDEVVYQAR